MFFVFDYFDHQKFSSFFHNCELKTVKIYMYRLLKTLAILAKFKVIHRDVKPENFIFNVRTGESRLIDFGLAEFESNVNLSIQGIPNDRQESSTGDSDWNYSNGSTSIQSNINLHDSNIANTIIDEFLSIQKSKNYSQRKGTRGFLAPEIIFQHSTQTCKVDVWSAGCILLSFFTKKISFFCINYERKDKSKKSDYLDDFFREFIPLVLLFGVEKVIEIAELYDANVFIPQKLSGYCIQGGLTNQDIYKRGDIGKIVEQGGLELLQACLELDYRKRSSAEDLLKFKFFDEVREELDQKELNDL